MSFPLATRKRGGFGLSIPEPMPVEFTRLSCHNRSFHLSFSGYSPSPRWRETAARVHRLRPPGQQGHPGPPPAAHAEDLGLIDKARQDVSVGGTQSRLLHVGRPVLSAKDGAGDCRRRSRFHSARWKEQVLRVGRRHSQNLPGRGETTSLMRAGLITSAITIRCLPGSEPPSASGDAGHAQGPGFPHDSVVHTVLGATGIQVEQEHPEYLIRRRDGSIYRTTAAARLPRLPRGPTCANTPGSARSSC